MSTLANWLLIGWLVFLPLWFVYQLVSGVVNYRPGSSSGSYHDEMRGRSSDMYDGGDGA